MTSLRWPAVSLLLAACCAGASALLPTSATAAAQAEQADAAPLRPVTIGYLDLEDDERYRSDGAYTGIVFRTLGRPFPGARLGIEDSRVLGRVAGVELGLRRATLRSPEQLAAQLERWAAEGVNLVLSDLPAEALLAASDAARELPILLLNVSATDDRLRGADCRKNVAHVIPSDSMLTDALVQYLVAKNWTGILVLRGPTRRDRARVEALRRSADKFGATILGERPFVLGNDPREREQNNVVLATRDTRSDVVFVADAGGEFGRYVPYGTAWPTPVVGDAGLRPLAWHWTWHRYGAPQVQHRLEALVPPRRMNDGIWASWVAVRAVAQAAARAGATSFEAMRNYLLGERMRLDGSKGSAMSFRAWNHQLRQPVLLATGEAVVARAPLEQFLHRTDDLDTLGAEEAGSGCRF